MQTARTFYFGLRGRSLIFWILSDFGTTCDPSENRELRKDATVRTCVCNHGARKQVGSGYA